MKDLYRRYVQEISFYLTSWFLVLVVPFFRESYLYAVGDLQRFDWVEVGYDYLGYLPFLLCFFLGKLIFEPRIYFQGNPRKYLLCTFLSCLLITSLYMYVAPSPRHRWIRHMLREGQTIEWAERQPEPPRERTFLRSPFLPMFLVSLLMEGASLSAAIFFRQRREELQRRETQTAHLQSELDYLTYQINPHFFMNTLNNIHALVDIDSEAAKEAIIELSKLMRYLLYESDRPTVSLSKEVSFLQHYLELMRIRCDESVSVTFRLPSDPSLLHRYEVPPLLLISFVENAFKHGISHRHPSFIDISLDVKEDRLHFLCRNSNFSHESHTLQQGGIGLDNVRKRLALLYPDRYTLIIEPTEAEFRIDLQLLL